MIFSQEFCATLKLLAAYLLVAVIICAVLFISNKLLKRFKFNSYVKRHPYWLIKVFIFSALYYPFVVEMLKKSKNCNIKTTGELLFSYKDYFITAIGLCLAAASFIREDMNRKKEITAAINSMAKLKNDEYELKLKSCDKEKEQDQESK